MEKDLIEFKIYCRIIDKNFSGWTRMKKGKVEDDRRLAIILLRPLLILNFRKYEKFNMLKPLKKREYLFAFQDDNV